MPEARGPVTIGRMAFLRAFSGFNIAAPGANTGAISGGLADLPDETILLRIGISLTTSSVVNVTATDGSTTHKWGLKESAALNAADFYTFELPAMPALTYNVEVETDGVIEQLIVDAEVA